MKSKAYTVCVVDDEPDIRETLAAILNKSPHFDVVGEASSAPKSIELIKKCRPDVIFLDIKLEEGDAFIVMESLRYQMKKMPAVILNTAHSEFDYAQRTLHEFKDCVLLILKKPFWEDWKTKEIQIVQNVESYIRKKKGSFEFIDNRIKIKSDYQTWLVNLEDLVYMEVPLNNKGAGKVSLYTSEESFTISQSLNSLQKKLPRHFMRISRYTIINTKYFSHVNHSDRTIFLKGFKKKSFGLGDAFADELFQALGI